MTTVADLLLVDTDVLTLDPARPRASAVAVGDGRVLAVGDDDAVRPWRGPHTEVISLAGGCVTPGLVDGHLHPVLGLDLAVGADLSTCRTPEQVAAALRAQAATTAPGEWVRGWGLDPTSMGSQPLSRTFLDPLVDGAPAYVMLFDAHAALVSSAALRMAGIDGPVVFDQAAEVVCDPTGAPTGLLQEAAAVELVQRVLPVPSPDERLRRLREILDGFAALGLTGAHVMDAEGGSLNLYAALEATGDLPMRLRVAPWVMPGVDDDALIALYQLQRARGRRWRVEGVKLFIDGTIDAGTAWLDAPDTLGQSTASFWPDPAAYSAAIAFFAARGVATATHAIGDAGVRHVLAALASGVPAGSLVRHRLEHLETLPDDLVAAVAASGAVVSMQPRHCSDFVGADHDDNWSRRLGDERAEHGWRIKDLWDAGATVVLGSDWPVAPVDPRTVMASARSRQRLGEPDAPPIGPEQALSPLQALVGCTANAALAAGEGLAAGRIAVGMRADLTVFGVDPTAVGDAELPAVPVLATVVGGTLAHRGAGVG